MTAPNLDGFTSIVERAREETPPSVDVSDRVLKTLRAVRGTPIPFEPFLAAVSFSAAAAALLVAFVLRPDLELEGASYFALFQTAATVMR